MFRFEALKAFLYDLGYMVHDEWDEVENLKLKTVTLNAL